jgi:hypothetical protein
LRGALAVVGLAVPMKQGKTFLAMEKPVCLVTSSPTKTGAKAEKPEANNHHSQKHAAKVSGQPMIDTRSLLANISGTSFKRTMPASRARREDRLTMAEYHGKPSDPDTICQDDYEWLTETGPYAHDRIVIIRRWLQKRRDALLTARKSTSRSLLQAYVHSPSSVVVPALEAVKEALTEQICTLDFRLALLDAYPHAGYYLLGTPLLIGDQIKSNHNHMSVKNGEMEGQTW